VVVTKSYKFNASNYDNPYVETFEVIQNPINSRLSSDNIAMLSDLNVVDKVGFEVIKPNAYPNKYK
jgi:hypothetical protein